MNDESLDFLRTLLETPSPSGFETRGQRVWVDYAAKYADKVESDAYGNTFAFLNPTGTPKILVAGHGDELGLMISHIDSNGFLFFKGIGGVDRGLLRGQRVIVHNRKASVRGVIGHLAIHLQEVDDRKKVPEFHNLFIDIGANGKEEAETMVRVGDPVTIEALPVMLANNRMAARGCDNRIGTWAAAETLRLLSISTTDLHSSIVAVSTIQEENGLYGATMASYRVKPDLALIIDVTHATDIPPCSATKHGSVKLGRGPVISLGSANHPVLCERLIELAAKEGIPVQLEANPRHTGTDADTVFLQRGGIPTVSIGLPNRYMHSPVEVIDLQDLQAIPQLLAAFCREISDDDKFSVVI